MKRKEIALLATFVSIIILTTTIIPTSAIINISEDNFQLEEIDREAWWWPTATLVSVDSTDDSLDLKTVIDENDTIHLCWVDHTALAGSGLDQDVFYRNIDLDSNSWSPVELVSSESAGDSANPSIALDDEENIHIVWDDSEDYLSSGTDHDVFYKMKDYSTGVWSSAEVVSTSSDFNSYDPNLDVDSEGDVHVVWYDGHDYDGTDIDIIYKVRDSATDTWSSPTVISTDSLSSSYSPRIAVDSNDFVHVTWYDYTANLYGSGPFADVMYKKWDPINNWSDGLVLSYESTGDDSYTTCILIDVTDSIHVAWHDSSDILSSGPDRDIVYRKFDSATSTWSDLKLISIESDSPSASVSLNVDSDFNVHFAWQDSANIRGAGSDVDLFYKSLDAETNELSDLVLLSDLSDADTFGPKINIDSYGFLHIIYSDFSDILSAGADQDLFYKKYIGLPGIPILHPITPTISSDNNISLSWSEEISADSYKVYRSKSYITDITGLSVLATTSNPLFFDSLNETGIFYYAVAASNNYGDSEISNSEFVEYQGGGVGNLFANLDWGEIIIIGGILGALQIITAVILFVTISTNKSSSSSKKKKK